MVCEGPEPPDNSPQELSPPAAHSLLMSGARADTAGSDDELSDRDREGYQPLPQASPAARYHSHSDDEDQSADEAQGATEEAVPPIEAMERVLTRDVWSTPRPTDPIQMDSERAQQVMSAMANFALPPSAIPQWAQCVTEEQWREMLHQRIHDLNHN